MTHTMRRLSALWCFAALWLWTSAAWADVKDCKPWEAGCQFKAPDKIVSQCSFGEVEVEPGRCCWKGQTWDDKALVCRGEAVCDVDGKMELSGGACVPSTPWMVFHQQRCEQGYLGDCWRWARLSVPTIEEGGDSLRTLPATALGPVLRPLCERGIKQACAHLGAVLTAEELPLREAAIPTLNAHKQTPAYVEGLALLRSTCDEGVADGCYALGEALSMLRGESATPAPGAVALYARACDMGHSAACYRTLRGYRLLEAAQLPTYLAIKERACLGGPLPRCTDPFYAKPHLHTARAVKTEQEVEALWIAQARATHDGCLRGDLESCKPPRGEPDLSAELRFVHHPPLRLDKAAMQRTVVQARLEGEGTRAMRCRMGMIGEQDVCGLEAWSAKKRKPEEMARALAFHERACSSAPRYKGHCQAPFLAWRRLLAQSPIEQLNAIKVSLSDRRLPKNLEQMPPSWRDELYDVMLGDLHPSSFTRDELNAFSQSGASASPRPPLSPRIQAMRADALALCEQDPAHANACRVAMGTAILRGDVKEYKRLRDRQPPILERWPDWRAHLTSTEYQSLRATLKRHCMEYGEHCSDYVELLRADDANLKKIIDLPGEPRALPKPAPVEEVRVALSRGCAGMDAQACKSLASWLDDAKRYPDAQARTDATNAKWSACVINKGFDACLEIKAALLTEARRAKLDELSCFSAEARWEPKRCASTLAQEPAPGLDTLQALCGLGYCAPLLDALDRDTKAADRATRLHALATLCSHISSTDKARCDQLHAELLREPMPDVERSLVEDCASNSAELEEACGVLSGLLSALRDDKRQQRRHEQLALELCQHGDSAACEQWLARQAPDKAKPLSKTAFAGLRDACSAQSSIACESLWRAWQAQRTQLSLEEGRAVGAMACLLNGPRGKLCEDVIKSRLTGKQDSAAYEYIGALYLKPCLNKDVASCDALRTMHKEGKLVASVRERFLEHFLAKQRTLGIVGSTKPLQKPDEALLQELTR